MSLRKLSVGIASVIVLAAGVPAFANEAAITQDNVQTTRASGRGATATSTSNQEANIRQRGRNGNEAGIGQTSDQLTEASGRRSSASSDNGQVGNINQSGRRR
jgi:uncharacterized protein YfiM (DUF2279 family)